MTDERGNLETVVHEVDRAELAQVDGGDDIPPLCGTHTPNPWPWLPSHPPRVVQ
jgi:hypothetical protein